MPFCAVAGCSNSSRKKMGVTYHKFPKNPKLRQKWKDAMSLNRPGWEPGIYSYICTAHFKEADIDRTSLLKVRVREDRVPSIFKPLKIKNKKSTESQNTDHTYTLEYDEELANPVEEVETSEVVPIALVSKVYSVPDAPSTVKHAHSINGNIPALGDFDQQLLHVLPLTSTASQDNSDNLPFTYDQEADNQPFLDNQEAATEDDVNPESDLNQENYSDHEIDIKPDISLMEVHFPDPPKPQVTVTSAVSRELEPEPIHTTTSGAHSLKRKRSAYGDNDGNDDDNDNNFSHEFDFESDSKKVRQAYKLLKSVFEKGDRFDTFGERIAKRIRALPTDQVRLNVEQIIETVLWKAECGKYDNYHNPEDVAQDPLSLSPGTSKIFN